MSVRTVKLSTIEEERKNLQQGDGLENLVASLGTKGDKRHHTTFVNKIRLSDNEQELNALYRTDWLAGKVVDIIPDDMTREWISIIGDESPDEVAEINDTLENLDVRGAFNFAKKWSRLYGSALIILIVDDGQTPDKPLNFDAIKAGGLQHIKVIDSTQFENDNVVPTTNPLSANYGFPEFYRFNETAVVIHHSRVLRFDGVMLPYQEFRRNNWKGDSVLDRVYESLLNMNIAANSSASMIFETNVDIVHVKGLMNYLESPNGEELIRKRFALANLLKSFNNVHLLDQDETFDTKNNTFSGLPDLIDRFAQLLSAATDIPATRLLGVSASGFNATGEGDLKNYYDKVKSLQITDFKPKLDYLFKIIQKSLQLPDEFNIEYEFNSLFQMTPGEEAEIQFKNSQTARTYWDMGVLDAVIIAKELQQDRIYTNITPEHIKELEGALDDDFFTSNPETIRPEEQATNAGEETENSAAS
jgi:hypothetical protein